MRIIASAILLGAAIVTGSHVYLERYEVLPGDSAVSYRVYDRLSRQLTYCVRSENRGTAAPDLDCYVWAPAVGGQP